MSGGASDATVRHRRRSQGGRVRLAFEITISYGYLTLTRRRRSVREVLGKVRDRRLELPPVSRGRDDDPVRLARATQRMLCLLPGDTRCLTQSMVLSMLLARRNVPSRVVIAVLAPGQEHTAHAWVELDGTPLLRVSGARGARLVEL
jgi:hypothetical protein